MSLKITLLKRLSQLKGANELNKSHCNIEIENCGQLVGGIESSNRAESRFATSQWEMALLCNNVSHWLGASLESAMQ